METPDDPPRHKPRGRKVALAFVLVWVVMLIGLYWVIVKLKWGGPDALRTQPAPHKAAAARQ